LTDRGEYLKRSLHSLGYFSPAAFFVLRVFSHFVESKLNSLMMNSWGVVTEYE
jgi:hypothetical protein